jgi:hypothetical protein
VELLMRRKKNSALGVKWLNGDDITNMEGAMHSFVTPIISGCEINGDYRYSPIFGGHGIDRFGDTLQRSRTDGSKRKYQLTRFVVLSASIQMDFEDAKVMLSACMLDGFEKLSVTIYHPIAHGLFSTRRRSRMTNKDEPMMNHYGGISYIILRKHVDYLQEKALKVYWISMKQSSFWSYSSQRR